MGFAFRHRQAVVMRFYAAGQNVVAVDHQVVRGHGGGQITGLALDVFNCVRGGDMFHDYPQFGGGTAQRCQHAIYKNGLAVKDINLWIRDFAVHT